MNAATVGNKALVAVTHTRTRRGRLLDAADLAAAAVVLTLPWSTSATSILIVVWLVVVVPTIDVALIRKHLARPAVFAPILLWCIACLGMLWSDASWGDRLNGLRSFHKLLAIPLLMIHFSQSARALQLIAVFLVSSTALMLYSWASLQFPALVFGGRMPGVPVKDYIYQGIFFALSAAGLVHLAITGWRAGVWRAALGYVALAALFVGNILFVAVARTALVLLPILLFVIGYQRLSGRGILLFLAGVATAGAVTFASSPFLRERVTVMVERVIEHRPQEETSEALRIEFWRKSLVSIRDAPIIGYGTGYTRTFFENMRVGTGGAAAAVINNPHNQVFAIGIQLGSVGIAFLLFLWASHIALFIGASLPARLGFLVVVQNIVTSLFNSHISDFTAGWLYVLGVGIFGGAVLAQQERSRRAAACS